MLYGVDDHRAPTPLDRDEPLDPQQIGAARSGQYRHRLLKHRPWQRELKGQHKAVDAAGMGVRMVVLVPLHPRDEIKAFLQQKIWRDDAMHGSPYRRGA